MEIVDIFLIILSLLAMGVGITLLYVSTRYGKFTLFIISAFLILVSTVFMLISLPFENHETQDIINESDMIYCPVCGKQLT